MGKLDRISIHWTAGSYKACSTDRAAYHFLVDGDAEVIKGDLPPEANIDCTDGVYAHHTGGFNTGTIGVAACGMHRFPNTKYPLKKQQCERLWKLIAELAKKDSIPIDKDHILTHYEVGLKLPNSSSAGKSDINFLPYEPSIPRNEVGDYIRAKVKWYFDRL